MAAMEEIENIILEAKIDGEIHHDDIENGEVKNVPTIKPLKKL